MMIVFDENNAIPVDRITAIRRDPAELMTYVWVDTPPGGQWFRIPDVTFADAVEKYNKAKQSVDERMRQILAGEK